MRPDDPNLTHWQDAGNFLLACWLIPSPELLNYKYEQLPVWNGYAVAFAIAVFSAAAMLKFAKWEEWINITVGLWLIASPWLLGYSTTAAAAWNHVTVGVLVIVLSSSELNAAEQIA